MKGKRLHEPVVFKAELNVLSSIIHEDIYHGKIDISRIGKLQITNMQGLSLKNTSCNRKKLVFPLIMSIRDKFLPIQNLSR